MSMPVPAGFHITTRAAWREIGTDGVLRPRSALTIVNDLADPNLVSARQRSRLPTGLRVTDAVPFHVHPVQPMFVRLLVEGRLALEDLIVLEVCPHAPQLRNCDTFAYSTNPAYDEALFLGSWTSALSELGLEGSVPWYSVFDVGLRHRAMIGRQAEVLITPCVPVNAIQVVHRMEGGTEEESASRRLFEEYARAVEAVHDWWATRG